MATVGRTTRSRRWATATGVLVATAVALGASVGTPAGAADEPDPVVTAPPFARPTFEPAAMAPGPVTIAWNWASPDGVAIDPGRCEATTVVEVHGRHTVVAECFDVEGNGRRDRTTVVVDTAPPALEVLDLQASYTVDETVAIRCAAYDFDTGATCTSPPARPAWGYPVGRNEVTVSAVDGVGNTAEQVVSFDVEVTFASLARLTERFADDAGAATQLTALLASAAADEADEAEAAELLTRYAAGLVNGTGTVFAPADAAVLVDLAVALGAGPDAGPGAEVLGARASAGTGAGAPAPAAAPAVAGPVVVAPAFTG
jgi:hypothetical protein